VEPREPGTGETSDGETPSPAPGASAPPTSTPPPTPPIRKSGLAFFGLVLVLFLPGIVAQAMNLAFGLLWTQLFAFLLPALVLTTGSNLEPRAFLRLGPTRPALIGLGFLAGLGGYVHATGVMGLAREAMPEGWLRVFDVARVFEGSTRERVAIALIAALVAPVCEEIAFRGYLPSALSTRLRPAAAVAASTVLFAAIHLDPVRFPGLIVLGGVFGWLAWRGGSLWPAVAAHAANNALVSSLVLAGVAAPDETTDLPELPVRLRAAAAALLVGAAILWPLLRAYAAAARAAPAPRVVALCDPAVPSARFSLQRVPAPLRAAVVLGAAGLVGLALAGAAGLLGARG
jgi:hypothetical protein